MQFIFYRDLFGKRRHPLSWGPSELKIQPEARLRSRWNGEMETSLPELNAAAKADAITIAVGLGLGIDALLDALWLCEEDEVLRETERLHHRLVAERIHGWRPFYIELHSDNIGVVERDMLESLPGLNTINPLVRTRFIDERRCHRDRYFDPANGQWPPIRLGAEDDSRVHLAQSLNAIGNRVREDVQLAA